MKNLYKVKLKTELMVVANSSSEAIEIAKKNAPGEIATYGIGVASVVKRLNEIPDDWKSVIPYASEGTQETKRCYELIDSGEKSGLDEEEIKHIVEIQETKKGNIEVDDSIKPETRSDPIPPKLEWHETKSGRPLPKLRFIK